MARYREARVGRDKAPKKSTTPSWQIPMKKPIVKDSLSATIRDRVASSSPEFLDITQQVDMTIDDYIDNLSSEQKRFLAQFLKDSKIPGITTIKDISNVLTSGGAFDFVEIDFRSFNAFLRAISNQIVTKTPTGGGTGESLSVTQYGKEQVDSWIDDWLTKNAGMGQAAITPEQTKVLRQAVRDYASKAAVTKVTTDKKGRKVTTYTPGATTEGVQKTIESAASQLFPQEIERNKVLEFNDIVSKTLGTGSI